MFGQIFPVKQKRELDQGVYARFSPSYKKGLFKVSVKFDDGSKKNIYSGDDVKIAFRVYGDVSVVKPIEDDHSNSTSAKKQA